MRNHRNDRAGRQRPRADAHTAPVDPEQDTQFENDVPDSAGDDFFRRLGGRKADQKARQLCRQVYRTLSVALPGCGDAVLQDLTVLSVDPAPDAGHLLVTVTSGGGERVSVSDVLGRLAGAAGRLRAEVARDIVRKRAPELAFRILPRKEVRHD